MAYTFANFSYGELASDISDAALQITLVSGNSVPKSGSVILVVWDMDTFPNPADDANTEIMVAVYSGSGEVFNVQRGQESTVAVSHSSGNQVALHMTAGALNSERLVIGSQTVDEALKGDGKVLVASGANLVYGGHDDLSGYVVDEHVAHSGVSVIAGADLTGGGTIDSDVTLNVDPASGANWDTAYGHSLLVAGNPHIVTPTELSLVIGTDVQAWDTQLDDIAALAFTDGNFIVGDGTNWVAESGNTARTSLGLGTTDSPTFAGLTITNETLSFTESYSCLDINVTKTDGASDVNDKYNGTDILVELNQAGGMVGYFKGLNVTTKLSVGEVGDTDNFRSIYGQYVKTDLNGGKIWGDAYGLQFVVDQEAANEVTGNVFAMRLLTDCDGTVGGTVYNLYMSEGNNVDYGIYNGGAADNYLAGKLGIGINAPLAKLDVVGDARFGDSATNYVSISGSGVMAFTGAAYIGGDVGIGQIGPLSRLHVSKSDNTAAINWMGQLHNTWAASDMGGTGVGLKLKTYSYGTSGLKLNKWTGIASESQSLPTFGKRVDQVFYTVANADVDVPTEKMRLTGPGLLGIGVTAPLATLDVVGDTRLGDSVTNYLAVSAIGVVTFHGTSRATVDQWIDAGGIKAPGAKPPVEIAFGILETPAWQFGNEAIAGNQEYVTFSIKFPEDMDKSVAPAMCAGWSADGISPGNCEWELTYLYTALGEDTGAAAQDTDTVTVAASAIADGLIISSFNGMDVAGAADVCLHGKLRRLSAGANDTIADTVELHGISMTYTLNKLGAAI